MLRTVLRQRMNRSEYRLGSSTDGSFITAVLNDFSSRFFSEYVYHV